METYLKKFFSFEYSNTKKEHFVEILIKFWMGGLILTFITSQILMIYNIIS
jgi:hypothetical protein